MHVVWPRVATPTWTHNHDPYGDAELEPCPLEWDTHTAYITAGDLAGLGLISDAAQPLQGSYWPNEPPVLPPAGYYWYDYGPVGRGMNFYKTLPIGRRPSAAEQAADLAKHRKVFEAGQVPEGLREALAEHGLVLDDSKARKWVSNIVAVSFVFAGLGLVYKLLGIKAE